MPFGLLTCNSSRTRSQAESTRWRVYRRVAEGMPISESLRRYRQECGAVDPRSTTKVMSYEAFKRLLNRPAYLGIWQLGRKRNQWSDDRDAVEQVDQPEQDVKVVHWPHLQIVDEDVFWQVQARLDNQKSGPPGPRAPRQSAMWDLVTETFVCGNCEHRFYTAGSRGGHAMQCPNPTCPNRGTISRKEAVLAVAQKLEQLIHRDRNLMAEAIQTAQTINAERVDQLRAEVEMHNKRIQRIDAQINGLFEIIGDGSEKDRQIVKDKIKAKRAERRAAELERAQSEKALKNVDAAITPDQVREHLDHFAECLAAAGEGRLSEEAVHEAAEVFRQLVGGRIEVTFEPRPGRKATTVRAVFKPSLLEPVSQEVTLADDVATMPPVHVLLRRPPRDDLLAPVVAYLYDVLGTRRTVTFPGITTMLNEAGVKLGCGNVYQSRRRWYEMIDQPPVKRRPARRIAG